MSKIIFLGTPLFALPILKSLIEKKYNILSVFSQPPSKSKRGQNILKSPIQVFSEDVGSILEFKNRRKICNFRKNEV